MLSETGFGDQYPSSRMGSIVVLLGCLNKRGELISIEKKKKKTREESLQMRSTDSLLAALIYQSLPVGDKEPSLRFPLR